MSSSEHGFAHWIELRSTFQSSHTARSQSTWSINSFVPARAFTQRTSRLHYSPHPVTLLGRALQVPIATYIHRCALDLPTASERSQSVAFALQGLSAPTPVDQQTTKTRFEELGLGGQPYDLPVRNRLVTSSPSERVSHRH